MVVNQLESSIKRVFSSVVLGAATIMLVFAWQGCSSDNKGLNEINNTGNTSFTETDTGGNYYEYNLMVINGSVSGNYTPGTNVDIQAINSPEGHRFNQWVTEDCEPEIEDINSANTSMIVPETFCTVIATYVFDDGESPDSYYTYNLTVKNGSGSGNYNSGANVNIQANNPLEAHRFDRWIPQNCNPQINNVTSENTTLVMPSTNCTVVATFVYDGGNNGGYNYYLTVKNGNGSGSYNSGANVQIRANNPPYDQVFDRWVPQNCNPQIYNANQMNTTLVMPSQNCTVVATYKYDNGGGNYYLTVKNGNGSGNYNSGANVQIRANNPPYDQVFDRWQAQNCNPQIYNANQMNTTLVMPSSNCTVVATYRYDNGGGNYYLTVKNGNGSGNYNSGANVQIRANNPPYDQVFDRWQAQNCNPQINNPNQMNTTLVMPSQNCTVEATYRYDGGTGNCISDQSGLRNRLQNAYYGETISLCGGRTIYINSEISSSARDIRIESQNGNCVLEMQGSGRIMSLYGDGVTVQGVTFKNGNYTSGNGGALYLKGNATQVIDCEFANNKASNGGAIYAEGKMDRLMNTRFFANQAYQRGGAAYFSSYPNNESGNYGSGNAAKQCSSFYYHYSGLCGNLSTNPY